MHERNPYRSALLWIAILVGGVGLVAWFIGVFQLDMLDGSSSNDDPVEGVGTFAIAIGNLGIAGGAIATLLWLVLSGVTWALDAEKVKETEAANAESRSGSGSDSAPSS
jgi:hypothetical protein